MSIIISGAPRSGKTTLAKLHLPGPVLSTDDFRQMDFRAQDEEVATQIALGNHNVIEGCQAVRGVRYWLEAHWDSDPTSRPCEIFIWLTRPYVELSSNQKSYYKGLTTVFSQIYSRLRELGVVVLVQGPEDLWD